jgi:hypothetical protein
MIRVNDNKRRDYWGCQIKGKLPRPRKPPIGRPSLQDITNKKQKEKHY